MDQNFVINWLQNHFDNPNLDENELKPLLHFSLIWNLFEHTYFTDEIHLSPARLIELSRISYDTLEEAELNNIFNYFKNRYFQGNVGNNRFNTLRLSKENSISCAETFTNPAPTNENKSKTVFLIIHRFRNNLFHGRKNPETLNVYNQPFNQINLFLIHFISTTAENNSLNSNRFNN